MKEEVKRWIEKAKSDLVKAKDNFGFGHYDLASSLCQQCVEKALKAAIIKKKKDFPKIHDLVRLAKIIDISKELIDGCERLTYIEDFVDWLNIFNNVNPLITTKSDY